MFRALLPVILPLRSTASALSVRAPVPVLTSLPSAVFSLFPSRFSAFPFVLIFVEASRSIVPASGFVRIVVASTKFRVPPTLTLPETSCLPR